MDKELIAARFERAKDTYNEAAVIQHQIAHNTLSLLQCHACHSAFTRIAEIGCGTGHLTRKLVDAYQPSNLWVNDLCAGMGSFVESLSGVSFTPGDAEKIDIPSDRQLIASCSTVQWFTDIPSFISRCNAALQPGGWLAISTFSTENMKEISSLTGAGLPYLSLQEWKAILSPNFTIHHISEESIEAEFPNPMEVLKHLRSTGVTGTGGEGWTPKRLAQFCEAYSQQFKSEAGVKLTYAPIYIIAQKK